MKYKLEFDSLRQLETMYNKLKSIYAAEMSLLEQWCVDAGVKPEYVRKGDFTAIHFDLNQDFFTDKEKGEANKALYEKMPKIDIEACIKRAQDAVK